MWELTDKLLEDPESYTNIPRMESTFKQLLYIEKKILTFVKEFQAYARKPVLQ